MVFAKSSWLVLIGIVSFLALAAITAQIYTGDPDGAQVKIDENAIVAKVRSGWQTAWSVAGPWLSGKETESGQLGGEVTAAVDNHSEDLGSRFREAWTKSHVYDYIMSNIRGKILESYYDVRSEYQSSGSASE